MSNPARTQQRFPFRAEVRIRKNYHVLPPISTTSRPEEPDFRETKSSLSSNNIEIEYETSPTDTNQFWINLRRHIDKQTVVNRNDHGKQHTSNKVVRIFVSSTFTDFFNEREVLIKKVIPALRDQLELLGIQIIDCDLRWGVPKDSTTEQTILTCLEELDRCFEENGQPFFIGLVGDKYGWVPKIEQLPRNITERYRWIDGASITLMEFIHGAFRTHNPNALFLVRQSENIIKRIPDQYKYKFRDKDELSQGQVTELKKNLPEMFPSEQVYSYDCFYNGLDSSTGRERVKIDGLNEFEEYATQFVFQAIKKWYPDNFKNDDSSNSEKKKVTTFLINKTQFYIDRRQEFSLLLKFITGDHKNFKLIDGKVAEYKNCPIFMALTGPSGFGKTMLLGNFVLHIEENFKDNFLFFYYFHDGSSHPNSSLFMYNSLSQRLETYLDNNNLMSRQTGERLKITSEDFLEQAISLLPIPLVIIVDGLDKGDTSQDRNYAVRFPFDYLLSLISERTYIIISCETNSKLHENICNFSHYQVELEKLTIEQRQLYIEKFFNYYNKVLENEQKSLLVNNKGGENPLYLSYVCENLRQFGDYSLLTKRLQTYPQTINELLEVLLSEVYSIIDQPLLADIFFKLLIVSNIGIPETDVVNMLQFYINAYMNENDRILVDRMTWSTLRRHLKTFLDTTWIDGHSLIIFRHPSLEKKIRQRCLKESPQELRALHGCVADFHKKQPSIKEFSSRRIPYHYEQASMVNSLIMYLRSTDSRWVGPMDRQSFLRKHRCTKIIPMHDCVLNQRAYVCNVCAMLFRLGPYTMAKSSCFVCTNMIIGGSHGDTSGFKREARLCQKHGSPGYPYTILCVACKRLHPKQVGSTPNVGDPVPLNICFDCWIKGGGAQPRCSGFEIE